MLLALGLLAPMAAAGKTSRSPGVARTTLALVDRTRPTDADVPGVSTVESRK